MSKNPWMIVDEEVEAYNANQYADMYRSTGFVISQLDYILNKGDSVLDIGCSAGANLYHIAKRFNTCSFTGIDINEHFLSVAHKKLSKLKINNVSLEKSCYDKYAHKHDIVGSSQVLGVLDFVEGEEFQKACLKLAKKGVYFFSMFSDRDLDFEIYVHDYNYSPPKRIPYCIYSLKKLEKIAKKEGFRLVHNHTFDINVDLPDIHKGRGTYTVKKEDGNRMMFTDILHLPWKFIYFERI